MYKGYNLKLSEGDFGNTFEDWYKKGLALYKDKCAKVEECIGKFKNADGSLNGSAMQSNWFPAIKADVFLSHSHKDEKLAIALAAYFDKVFGLSTFIDSCLWGYCDRMLEILDHHYCYDEASKTYDYKLRNLTTSHVHMMLSTALTQMMDSCECVILLNTPNSIKPEDTLNKVVSPWIYSELAATLLLRSRTPQEHRGVQAVLEQREFNHRPIVIEYNIKTDHLISINAQLIEDWRIKCMQKQEAYNKFAYFGEPVPKVKPLDILYEYE